MPDDNQQRAGITEADFAAAAALPDYKGRINLRCEHALQVEIENVAEDNRYPLYSASAVVRFCCLIGLEELRRWKPGDTLLGAIKSANDYAVRDKIQCDAFEMLDRMDERVKYYVDHRDFDEAVSFVAQIRSYFEGLENAFWKRQIVQEIDQRFITWWKVIEEARDIG